MSEEVRRVHGSVGVGEMPVETLVSKRPLEMLRNTSWPRYKQPDLPPDPNWVPEITSELLVYLDSQFPPDFIHGEGASLRGLDRWDAKRELVENLRRIYEAQQEEHE